MRLRLSALVVAVAALSGCLSSSIIGDGVPVLPTVLPALETTPFDSLGGAKLAFQRFATTAGSFRGIYVVDGAARTVQTLLSGRALDRAQLSPVTGTLAYGGQTASGASIFDTFITRLSDSVETRITSGAENEQYPSWSSDGAKLFFAYRASGKAIIVRQNPVAGAVRDSLILPDSQQFQYGIDSPVSVNAAGRLTVVVHASGWRMWAVDFSGANRVLLRTDARNDIGPIFQGAQWSPDGLKIAFLELNYDVADQLTSTTLKLMNGDGTGEVSIVTVATLPFTFQATALNDFSLCWLTASRVAFSAVGNDRASHIYIAKVTAPVTLTQVTTNSGVFDRGLSCRP